MFYQATFFLLYKLAVSSLQTSISIPLTSDVQVFETQWIDTLHSLRWDGLRGLVLLYSEVRHDILIMKVRTGEDFEEKCRFDHKVPSFVPRSTAAPPKSGSLQDGLQLQLYEPCMLVNQGIHVKMGTSYPRQTMRRTAKRLCRSRFPRCNSHTDIIPKVLVLPNTSRMRKQ